MGRELEDDLGISSKSELVAGETFDRARILFEFLDLALQLRVGTCQLGVFGPNLCDFGLEASEPRESLGGEHENR